MENYGTKELYDLRLKATSPMEIGNKRYEVGETILSFNDILIINFDELKSRVSARGGKKNKPRVTWEDTQEVTINFMKGTFSKTQFAFLSNSHIIQKQASAPYEITYSETKESDENGQIELRYVPKTLFIYDENGERITPLSVKNNLITLGNPYQSAQIDYTFDYIEDYQTYQLGVNLINGFLSLEAKMRLKDDQTGHNITGIIKMPKVKLMSDLSMRLGKDASPMVAQFSLTAYPSELSGDINICDITYLSSDIDE